MGLGLWIGWDFYRDFYGDYKKPLNIIQYYKTNNIKP